MDLQEDIAAKLEILKGCAATEKELLPQGDKVPADAQVFKDELARITKKCDVLVKGWVLLDNTVTELNSWVAKDKSAEGENQFSLEKMESTLGELKNIFKQKEKLVEGL